MLDLGRAMLRKELLYFVSLKLIFAGAITRVEPGFDFFRLRLFISFPSKNIIVLHVLHRTEDTEL